MNLLIRWFVNALSLYIVSKVVTGIHVKDFTTSLVAALIIGLINALIKPVLLLLTLPINILTLGLFTFILNAGLLLLAGRITPGFIVDGFWSALVGSILLSLISTILFSLIS
jgi:putative membrane protein